VVAVNVTEEMSEDFVRNKVVVPVEVHKIVSSMFQRSRPESFSFFCVDFSARCSLIKVEDCEGVHYR